MSNGQTPTADVLRAIRLMLNPPDASRDSENDRHHRKLAAASEGWYLPRDLVDNRRHITATVQRVIPKACEPTATTRLRKRLVEWRLIESRVAQRKDWKDRELKHPPIFIRLRRDADGVQRITSFILTAQAIHTLKPIPGLQKADMNPDVPGELAVLREWIQGEYFAQERAKAAESALYIDYRYYRLMADLVQVPGFEARYKKEVAEAGDLVKLHRRAYLEHLQRKSTASQIQRSEKKKRGGIVPSHISPPDRNDAVTVESLPKFSRILVRAAEPPFKLCSLEGGQHEVKPGRTDADLL